MDITRSYVKKFLSEADGLGGKEVMYVQEDNLNGWRFDASNMGMSGASTLTYDKQVALNSSDVVNGGANVMPQDTEELDLFVLAADPNSDNFKYQSEFMLLYTDK